MPAKDMKENVKDIHPMVMKTFIAGHAPADVVLSPKGLCAIILEFLRQWTWSYDRYSVYFRKFT